MLNLWDLLIRGVRRGYTCWNDRRILLPVSSCFYNFLVKAFLLFLHGMRLLVVVLWLLIFVFADIYTFFFISCLRKHTTSCNQRSALRLHRKKKLLIKAPFRCVISFLMHCRSLVMNFVCMTSVKTKRVQTAGTHPHPGPSQSTLPPQKRQKTGHSTMPPPSFAPTKKPTWAVAWKTAAQIWN